MVEALINYWTLEHFVFGLGIATIITIISKSNHRIPLISLFILLLWELFELRLYPGYWVDNVTNNVVDVLVGLLGVYAVIWVSKLVSKWIL